jgi:hypothetical protein
MDNKSLETIREDYEPPAIEDIPLHNDEQLLVGCKTAGGTSGGRANLFLCGPCRAPSAS